MSTVESPETPKLAAASRAIRANFDRGASSYSSFEAKNSFFAALIGGLLDLAPLPPGARVLDVGCGTGASTAALAEAVGRAGSVVGIDISLGMLREAQASLPESVALACLDGCSFASSFSAPFDAVVYNAVLFMLPDAAGSLASAKAVLKPGGAVLVSSLEGISVDGSPLADLLAREGHQPGRHSLSPWAKVEPLLRESFGGLTVRSVERELTPSLFLQFYGLEPMSAGLLPRLPYPERLAAVENLAARFEREGTRPVQRWVLAAAFKG